MNHAEGLDLSSIDFVDFGSGVGGSLASAEKRIGGRGLGIEQRPQKVAEAQSLGRNVILGDIFSLPAGLDVRYVTIDNVLEHLPSLPQVEQAIASAASIARDFIYIRHPSFEDEPYLNALGLKQYWSDWRDHPTHIALADFAKIVHKVGIRGWILHPVRAAWDSGDSTILPLHCGVDQHDYDYSKHGPKREVYFDRPVYYAWDIVLLLGAGRVRLEYLEDPERSDRRPRIVSE